MISVNRNVSGGALLSMRVGNIHARAVGIE